LPDTNAGSSSSPSLVRSFSLGDFAALSEQAGAAERRRAHLLVHPTPQAAVQRFFLALEPGTYVRPHRHSEAHKWEFLTLLRGQLELLLFSTDGVLRERISLAPTSTLAVEIPAGIFHAYVCRESGTLALEVKEGAFTPTPESDFATWAPAERAPGASAFEAWMRSAIPGARAPRGNDAALLEDGGSP
jgi:cupin fold WbuC family metalloprotein